MFSHNSQVRSNKLDLIIHIVVSHFFFFFTSVSHFFLRPIIIFIYLTTKKMENETQLISDSHCIRLLLY